MYDHDRPLEAMRGELGPELYSRLVDNVARGVALLDRLRPGWRSRVDGSRLSMEDGTRCVLGQLAGGSSHYGYSDGYGDALEGLMADADDGTGDLTEYPPGYYFTSWNGFTVPIGYGLEWDERLRREEVSWDTLTLLWRDVLAQSAVSA